MSTTDKPVATIKHQAQTSPPPNSDATIMDDTVMTMDGLGLMGGLTVTTPISRQTLQIFKPTVKIKIRR